MTSPRSIVIAEPVRTAIGTFDGSLKDVTAPDLGAVAIGATMDVAFDPEEIGTAVMGQVDSGRRKDKSGPPSRRARWPAGYGSGFDRQPRVRLRRASDTCRRRRKFCSDRRMPPWPEEWRTWIRRLT